MHPSMAKTKTKETWTTDTSTRLWAASVSVCVWWVESGVQISVGLIAGCLGECCHHLQAVLMEVSPCFDPKPKCAIPFDLPAARWIELLSPCWSSSLLKAFASHCTILVEGMGWWGEEGVLWLFGGCKRSWTEF